MFCLQYGLTDESYKYCYRIDDVGRDAEDFFTVILFHLLQQEGTGLLSRYFLKATGSLPYR